MPYSNNSELPEHIKNPLPEAAQTIFRRAFNSTEKSHPDYKEERLFRISWAAVKNAGYKKGDDNKWVKESVSIILERKGSDWINDFIIYQCSIDKNNFELSQELDDYILSKPFTIIDIIDKGNNYILEAIIESKIVRLWTLSGMPSNFVPLEILNTRLTAMENSDLINVTE